MQERSLSKIAHRVVASVATGVVLAAGLVATTPASVRAAADNLVVNSGFEDGLADWFANPAGSATLSPTTDAYSGSGAVLVTNRTNTSSGPMQDLSGRLQPGKIYTVTARVK